MMVENKNAINANIIIEGIAFEAVDDNSVKKILAMDLYNDDYRASFILRGSELVLSVSSFKGQEREQALFEATRINSRLLIDEVLNA